MILVRLALRLVLLALTWAGIAVVVAGGLVYGVVIGIVLAVVWVWCALLGLSSPPRRKPPVSN